MKLIVIGASSFSGKEFCARAYADGHQVTELSRPDFSLNHMGAPWRVVHWIRQGYDTVINFAALNMVGESWEHAADYYQTNVVSIVRLAEALRRENGLRRFVQVSTPEVYGNTQTFLKEVADFNPTTPYAISRAACDMHLLALHRQYGFPVVLTRTVNVYGPGQQLYRLLPKTIACILKEEKLQLHGGGVSTRSFIHIGDVVDAILSVASEGASGRTYHVSTPRQTAIREIVQMICERMSVRFSDIVEDVAERPGKDMAYQLDDTRIRSELGWEDRISLEDGLDETIAWMRANFHPEQSTEYRHVA